MPSRCSVNNLCVKGYSESPMPKGVEGGTNPGTCPKLSLSRATLHCWWSRLASATASGDKRSNSFTFSACLIFHGVRLSFGPVSFKCCISLLTHHNLRRRSPVLFVLCNRPFFTFFTISRAACFRRIRLPMLALRTPTVRHTAEIMREGHSNCLPTLATLHLTYCVEAGVS